MKFMRERMNRTAGLATVVAGLAFASFAAAAAEVSVEMFDMSRQPGRVEAFGHAFQRAFCRADGVDFVRFSYEADKSWVWQTFGTAMPEGTAQIEFLWRVGGGTTNACGCCINVTDAAGQTYQVGCSIPGGEDWGISRADLSRPFNSWKDGGGKTDGRIHYPIRGIAISTGGVGAYDLAGIRAVISAEKNTLPGLFLAARPKGGVPFWYPAETIRYDLSVKSRIAGHDAPDRLSWALADYWHDECLTSGVWRVGSGSLAFAPKLFKGRFGSFRLLLKTPDGRVSRETWFSRLTGPDPEPCPWVGTIAGGPAAARHHAAMGIGVMNTGAGWDRCERRRGVYDFGNIGETITNLLSRGIRPHLMIHCENRAYENPLDPDAFAAFAGAYARHCADCGARDIEIFNEPCDKFVRQYGAGDWTAKFVEFTHKARAAIKKSAPEVTVVTCAEDMDFRLIPMLTNGIARAGDVISIHPYCHEQPRPERGWFYKDNGAFVKDVARRFCGTDRIRISEFGWTTYRGKGEYLEVAGHYPRASYAHQAQYLVRAYLIARISGVEYALQYRYDDLDRREYTEHNFGLVFEDGTPKPSFSAIAFMTRLLGKAEPRGERSADMSQYRISAFERSGRKIYACWAVEKEVDWRLPDDFGEVERCYDLMGNEIGTSADRKYRLTERPIYLVGGCNK